MRLKHEIALAISLVYAMFCSFFIKGHELIQKVFGEIIACMISYVLFHFLTVACEKDKKRMTTIVNKRKRVMAWKRRVRRLFNG